MKIALLCGGPSAERGISLNSARSVLDHLASPEREIVPIYFDQHKKAHLISPAQLYSNTPSDFDFKLAQTARKLGKIALVKTLKQCDIVFPVMHGPFGEDGEIQSFLERERIPFIGSPSSACKRAFDKHIANEFIAEQGFFTLPSVVLKIYKKDHRKILTEFFTTNRIKRAIVKPATGGSSIGVFSVDTIDAALEKAQYLFSKRVDTRVVVEPFCTGREFTVIILENRFGLPVAILPTEIEADYTAHQIFDYRKKYLPTRQVKYHCPPRFANEDIEKIQVQAEQLFKILGMRDFARFDGFLRSDGTIWFSDFNPVSGMEQNSFLFQQTARIGFSHRDTLKYIVRRSTERHGIDFAEDRMSTGRKRAFLPVLCGGQTSERQVSLMSGTNVWLKLRQSDRYAPQPFLWDLKERIWELPYALTLNHTVEEIQENCELAPEAEQKLAFLEEKVRLRLALKSGEATAPFFLPRQIKLEELLQKSDFLFLALHGGAGENGTLQRRLDGAGVQYNGSGAEASAIAMDKYCTGQKLHGLENSGIFVAPKQIATLDTLRKFSVPELKRFWNDLQQKLGAKTIIVKPQDEGCSAGIISLSSAADLQKYVQLATARISGVPAGTFPGQENIIEMPLQPIINLLFEPFLATAKITIRGKKLHWDPKQHWIEVTVGVLGAQGRMKALSPSLTVAEGAVLSVEEKFQGGTGVNITPPPPELLPLKLLQQVKKRIEIVAKKLGLKGYARIDAFVDTSNGNVVIIEANTLPALTPSTVLFHQGLAESKPLFPRELLEKIIRCSRK